VISRGVNLTDPVLKLLDRALSFANIGFLVGGAVGFMMRPEGLNLEAVISRGVNLTDPVLKLLAQSSFNHMVLGALAGAVVGAAIGYALHKFIADVG
jgi:cytochrome bd-type quinol oxidase subunit 1